MLTSVYVNIVCYDISDRYFKILLF